jgi:hypothetical protein
LSSAQLQVVLHLQFPGVQVHPSTQQSQQTWQQLQKQSEPVPDGAPEDWQWQ